MINGHVLAPGYRAEWMLDNPRIIQPDPEGYPGYFRYVKEGWEMLYNPTTKEVHHLSRMKKRQ